VSVPAGTLELPASFSRSDAVSKTTFPANRDREPLQVVAA
jgi:hypothetical protein